MTDPAVLRVASRVVNAGLLALCCFLAAGIANTLLSVALRPPPDVARATTTAPPPRPSASDRRVILTRNLFKTTPARPVESPAPVAEEVEETTLPLGLVGTIATSEPDTGWAALWDAKSRQRLIVEQGDPVAGGQAQVLRIERNRILLAEGGAVREIVANDDERHRPPRRAPPRRPRPAQRRPRPGSR